jgi:hypothetical protein
MAKMDIAPRKTDHLGLKAVTSMGDKSPKAKDKAKKQETAHKDQKRAMAVAKAPQAAAGGAKKTK